MLSFKKSRNLKYDIRKNLGILNPLLIKWMSLFCVFTVTFLFFFFAIKKSIYWDIFTSRDLFRAVGWLKGSPYWLGPEMSAGANLPGPVFYFLLFPALAFGNKVFSSSIFWAITWLSLTYTVAFHFLATIVKHKESLLLFLITFIAAMGPAMFQPLWFAWNPGFAIMFHVLSLMSLYYWRRTDENFYLYTAGATIALGMQVHFLISIHIVTVILFYFIKPRNPVGSLFLFLSLALLPIFLYNIMSYLYIFDTSSGSYLSYLNWLKIELFSEEWVKSILRVFNFEHMIPGIFLGALTIWKKLKTKKCPVTRSTRDLFIIMIIPMTPAILGARIFWYTFFIPIFLAILFSKWMDDFMSLISSKAVYDKKLTLLFVFGLFFFCSFVLFTQLSYPPAFNNFYSAVSLQRSVSLFTPLILLIIMNIKWSQKSFWKSSVLILCLFFMVQTKTIKWLVPQGEAAIPDRFSSSWPSYQDLRPIMERIFLETNWSPKEAMKRIYVVGIHTQQSLFSHYSLLTETIRKPLKVDLTNKLLEKPSGYMIIQHLKEFAGYSKESWRQYLSQSSLLSELLRQEVIRGNILLQSPQLYNLYWLIPYKITKMSMFHKGFHNTGQSYYWEEPEWLKNCASTQSFKNKDGLYYCSILPGLLKRAGVQIKFVDSTSQGSPHLIANIAFFGPLLGTPECVINYDHYALSLWANIRINVSCNKRNYQYALPDIGLDCRLQEKDAKNRGNLLLAPLELQVSLTKGSAAFSDCTKEKLTGVRLTFNNHFRHFSGLIKSKEKIIWKIH